MIRRVVFTETGDAEVLQVQSFDLPEPAADEIQIEVKAIGLNRFEIMFREGDYAVEPDLPSALGAEAVGIVKDVGANVSAFKIGDRVTTLPLSPVAGTGVYADAANVPASGAVHALPGTSNEVEAAIWCAYITAYGPMVAYGEAKPGRTVLITAGSSSTGMAAIEVAKDAGARVIATTRTGAKREMLLSHGADHVIATDSEPLTEQVLSLTNGEGAYMAFDNVGGALMPAVVDSVRAGGKIYEYGVLDGGGVSAGRIDMPIFQLFSKMIGFYSVYEIMQDKDRMQAARTWLDHAMNREAFQPMIAKTFKLDNIIEAHRYMESGSQIGKIVVFP